MLKFSVRKVNDAKYVLDDRNHRVELYDAHTRRGRLSGANHHSNKRRSVDKLVRGCVIFCEISREGREMTKTLVPATLTLLRKPLSGSRLKTQLMA